MSLAAICAATADLLCLLRSDLLCSEPAYQADGRYSVSHGHLEHGSVGVGL